MRLIDAYTLAVQIRDNVFHDFTDEFWGVMQCIREAPTIEPERKTGRWIPNSPVTMKCDQCGFVIKDWDWHRFNFCPNCGGYRGSH